MGYSPWRIGLYSLPWGGKESDTTERLSKEGTRGGYFRCVVWEIFSEKVMCKLLSER